MDLISILTDFTSSDGFIGSMKGVILQINPNARIVDLAHEITNFSIREGAFILKTNYRYFPEETVFCVVIDPGVGTNRRTIAVKTEHYYFVGPDNGIFYPIVQEESLEAIRILSNEKYFRSDVSHTFHGRDIFAPVSSHLSKNPNIFPSLGPELSKTTMVELRLDTFNIEKRKIEGEMIMEDGYGNLITNIPAKKFWGRKNETYTIQTENETITARYVSTFSEGRENEPILLEENHGYLQLSMKEASACEMLDIKPKNKFTLYREKVLQS